MMSTREHREAERKDSLNLLDYVIIDANGVPITRSMARTLNVSMKGILLETHIPLKKGQNLLITIGLGDNLLEIKAHVTHTEPCNQDKFCSGVGFENLDQKSTKVLQQYLDAFNAEIDE
ncbi:MAG: PilZ domain-containing protein [Proteobacteria bacterium]|nr:PilZ domain-containing protein [Pseudomonadota bacterium]MBU1715322.1 PilZ domain-containing protein [Pseudomonadota bacterium]